MATVTLSVTYDDYEIEHLCVRSKWNGQYECWARSHYGYLTDDFGRPVPSAHAIGYGPDPQSAFDAALVKVRKDYRRFLEEQNKNSPVPQRSIASDTQELLDLLF